MATLTVRRTAEGVVAPALAALLAVGLTACGGDDDSSGPATPSRTGSAASPPRETASSSPRSKEDFEASVSAEAARIRASASAALADAPGQGNAMADVSQGGVPTSRTDGKRAALVRVTNSTDEKAFYSVQVDFADADGKTLDSVVLGFADVAPGARAERYAISSKAVGEKSVPRIVKAQRTAP
ncbi:hypothetical protein [Streptomyces lunaelactis]|uniref:hypothetical protein n=1 Tax=Streptomyces lunaelactis TaxID=1535768 RepID=UPI001C2FF9E4|nr:hypothetical protein [Streptomyces lunaelactis]